MLPNATDTYSVEVNVSAFLQGSVWIGVQIDWDKKVDELDETNNIDTVPITIAGPDLQVELVSVTPPVAYPGQQVTLTYRVKNSEDVPVVNARLQNGLPGSLQPASGRD